MGEFNVIDHTADTGLAICANDLADLFATAAVGMTSLMIEGEIRGNCTVDIQLDSDCSDELLHAWLSEINYLFQVQQLIFCRFDVKNISDTSIDASVVGEEIDPERHICYTEIKAITYHKLFVHKVGDIWQAQIILTCKFLLELFMEKERKKVNVLVVDDDPSLQELITEILKLEDLTFDVAHNGKEAFGLAMQNSYKVILMDIKMPEWDGVTAIRSLDFVQEIQKIIVISAYLDSATLQELANEPLVVGWLEKPFDHTQLVEMIHRAMHKGKEKEAPEEKKDESSET